MQAVLLFNFFCYYMHGVIVHICLPLESGLRAGKVSSVPRRYEVTCFSWMQQTLYWLFIPFLMGESACVRAPSFYHDLLLGFLIWFIQAPRSLIYCSISLCQMNSTLPLKWMWGMPARMSARMLAWILNKLWLICNLWFPVSWVDGWNTRSAHSDSFHAV